MYFNLCFCFFTLGIPIGSASSAIGLKICAIAAAIKKYESVIKKEQGKIW